MEVKKKWWQYRGMERKECGKVALVGLVGFIICYLFRESESLFAFIMIEIGNIFGLILWIAGIMWIDKTIKYKRKYKRDLKFRIKKRLQELQINPDKDYQGYYKVVREEEKRFKENNS